MENNGEDNIRKIINEYYCLRRDERLKDIKNNVENRLSTENFNEKYNNAVCNKLSDWDYMEYCDSLDWSDNI